MRPPADRRPRPDEDDRQPDPEFDRVVRRAIRKAYHLGRKAGEREALSIIRALAAARGNR